jgi:hypothetical protein
MPSTGGGSSPLLVLRFLLKWIVIPYCIGLCLSEYLPSEIAQTAVDAILGTSTSTSTSTTIGASVQNTSVTTTDTARVLQKEQVHVPHKEEQQEEDDELLDHDVLQLQKEDLCWKRLLASLDEDDARIVQTFLGKPEDGVALILHRNGDVEGCGTNVDFLSHLRFTLNNLGAGCPAYFTKYSVESLLTSAFHQSSAGSSCISQEPDREETEGFLGYCDMGPDKTPILLDHAQLVPVVVDQAKSYLPCHFHSREGVRLTSFRDLIRTMVKAYKMQPNSTHCSDQEETCANAEQQQKQVHLYAVPAGRVFMFAPAFVGEIFDLPHIQGADPTQPVYMEVLSISPRIFDIFNFFTKEESDGLVTKAIAETKDSHRIKRSSTGTGGYNINTMRTSGACHGSRHAN